MSNEHEIRDLLARHRQAIHDKDAQSFVALMSDDPTVFSMAAPLAVSGKAVADAEGLRRWFETWDGPITQDTPDWHIVAGQDCAFAYGLTHMSGRKVGGDDVALWFRQTLGLKRVGGEWRVHHAHDSVPFAMDGSLRALVDLDPDSTVDPAEAVGAS